MTTMNVPTQVTPRTGKRATALAHAQDAASQSALGLDLVLFLAQGLAELACAHTLGLHALGQKRHHQRRQHGQQLARVGAQPRGLAQMGFGALLAAAEDVAEDGAAIGLGRGRACAATAEHRSQEAAQAAGRATAAEQAAKQAAHVQRALGAAVVALVSERERVARGLPGLRIVASATCGVSPSTPAVMSRIATAANVPQSMTSPAATSATGV